MSDGVYADDLRNVLAKKTPEILPRTPNRMRNRQQNRPAVRLAQRVIAITPLFWAKMDRGVTVKRADRKPPIPSLWEIVSKQFCRIPIKYLPGHHPEYGCRTLRRLQRRGRLLQMQLYHRWPPSPEKLRSASVQCGDAQSSLNSPYTASMGRIAGG